MAANTLRDLFIDEMKDAYDAEHRITKALPKMIEATTSDELIAAFTAHLKQTQEHIARLERVFKLFDQAPARKTCRAMVGLLEEGEELMKESGVSGLRDAALIAAAQKVEHYEMATYGCLRTWAEVMGEEKAQMLLQKTLDEEGASDELLTKIAMTLNAEALEGEDEEGGELVPVTRRPESRNHPAKKQSRAR